jgi:CheY-like chemotaxis protein
VTARPQLILVVEDDETTLKLEETFLAWAGYSFISAKDGRTALELAKSRRPALMVLDLMLPELHGIGVCQAIKSDPETRHIKVLVATIKSFGADRQQALQAGADGFLAKPVDQDGFISAIDALLGNK